MGRWEVLEMCSGRALAPQPLVLVRLLAPLVLSGLALFLWFAAYGPLLLLLFGQLWWGSIRLLGPAVFRKAVYNKNGSVSSSDNYVILVALFLYFSQRKKGNVNAKVLQKMFLMLSPLIFL